MSMKIHQNFPQKFTQKMSTKIHPKRGILIQCPQEFTKSVHENLPILSTKFTLYVHKKSATRNNVTKNGFVKKGYLPKAKEEQ